MTGNAYEAELQFFANAVMKREYEVIEEACKQAILSGTDGVLVIRNADGIHAGPSSEVPYGVIHHYPWGREV